MTISEKARIAAEIEAFENVDFSDCPELTDEQLAQLKPSRYRKSAAIMASIEQSLDWLYSEAVAFPNEGQVKSRVDLLRQNARELATLAGIG